MTPSQILTQFDVIHGHLRDASTASFRVDLGGGTHRSGDDFVRVRFLRESAAYLGLDWHRISATAKGIASKQ